MNGLMMALFGSAAGEANPQSVFSTDLYTGNASARTITNGINLLEEGGLVWIKGRGQLDGHFVFDTLRGVTKYLRTEENAGVAFAEVTSSPTLTAFNSSGFDLGTSGGINGSSETYVSWTFRKAVKFFDVITYTGDGAISRTFPHELGIAPGFMVVKNRDTTDRFWVYHRSRGASSYLVLNKNDGSASSSFPWASTTPTSTEFTTGVNANGNAYVAWLLAHDASSEGFIQADEYTGNGSSTGPVITLGWQPQWLLVKRYDTGGNWFIFDTERGIITSGNDKFLHPNVNTLEGSAQYIDLTSDGFQLKTTEISLNALNGKYIYLAIRKPT